MMKGSATVLYNNLTNSGRSSFHHEPTASKSRAALTRIASALRGLMRHRGRQVDM